MMLKLILLIWLERRNKMEKLIEMLEELNPEVDYTTEEHLIVILKMNLMLKYQLPKLSLVILTVLRLFGI